MTIESLMVVIIPALIIGIFAYLSYGWTRKDLEKREEEGRSILDRKDLRDLLIGLAIIFGSIILIPFIAGLILPLI